MNAEINREEPPGPKSPVWLAVLFSTLACGLGLTGALTRPIWHDELYTLWLARMPLADLVSALKVDSGPPLHYFVCHGLYSVLGWPEGSALGSFMVRLPSVVAFTLMPWVLLWWARGRSVVFFWATALTIVWLPMLYFATEARAYALLALVNAALWLLGPNLIRSGGARLVLFAALAAALPMLHYAGIVSFCFLPCLALFIPRSRWRSFAVALGAAALPLLAWSPVILGAPNASMEWVDTISGPGRPGLASIGVLAPAGPYPAVFKGPLAAIPASVSTAALLILMGGCLVGTVWWFRHREERLLIACPALGLLPLVALESAAVSGLPVYFAGRTESLVWILGAGLIAAFVGILPRSWRLLSAGPYAVISLCTIGMWLVELPDIQPPPGIVVGRALAPEVRKGDVIVVGGLWLLEVKHGLAEAWLVAAADFSSAISVRTIPRSQAQHPGWLNHRAITSAALVEEARDLEREMRRSGVRIWLVWSPDLPIERSLYPAFWAWRRERAVSSTTMLVDLFTPLPPQPQR